MVCSLLLLLLPSSSTVFSLYVPPSQLVQGEGFPVSHHFSRSWFYGFRRPLIIPSLYQPLPPFPEKKKKLNHSHTSFFSCAYLLNSKWWNFVRRKFRMVGATTTGPLKIWLYYKQTSTPSKRTITVTRWLLGGKALLLSMLSMRPHW